MKAKYLWIDTEYTDFDYKNNLLLEIAVIVTDENLNTIVACSYRIWNQPQALRMRLAHNDFWKDKANELVTVNSRGQTLDVVESRIHSIIKKHFDNPPILAGSSIYTDRLVLREKMPELESLLHYRMLDVTSFKLMLEPKGYVFEKQLNHIAELDIEESIAELKYYLTGLGIR